MKKMLLTIGSITSIAAPLATTIACGSSSGSHTDHPTAISELQQGTHYKLNKKDNTPWLQLEAIEKAEWDKLKEAAEKLATDYENSTDVSASETIWFTDKTGTANWVELLLPEVKFTNNQGDAKTGKELSSARRTGLFLEAIISRSIERSLADTTKSTVESTWKAYHDKSETSGSKISEYFSSWNKIQTDIYGLTKVDLTEITYNPFDLTSFDVTKEGTTNVINSENSEVSTIDNTEVAMKDTTKLPDGVKIKVLDYWKEDTGNAFIKADSESSPAVAEVKSYKFTIDNMNLYQNIYLQPDFTDKTMHDTKFIGAEYMELLEIIKLGNGVSDTMKARRTAYAGTGN